MIEFFEYIGILFVVGGWDWCGCDCWGLLRFIYKECLGVDLLVYIGYDYLLGDDVVVLI